MTTDPAPASKAPETGQPPAMTPYAIAVVLFAAFAVGGILARQCHYGSSFLPGVDGRAAVFVFVDRYPRLPGRG